MQQHADRNVARYLAKQPNGKTILICVKCALDHQPAFTCKALSLEKAQALNIGCQCRHESHHVTPTIMGADA